MLNESLILLSFDSLKNILLHEMTIFHLAVVYVLMYVIYRALGRYIYFKPQEHASKVNRTFLTLSILIVTIQSLHGVIIYLPFRPEYRWLYVLCTLIIFIAPLSMIMHRIMWKYDKNGGKRRKDWRYKYLPILPDYYRTTISKSESNGSFSNNWEEEAVETTEENIHSDALLNVFALAIFIIVSMKWASDSVLDNGNLAYIFSAISSLVIGGFFSNNAIFSWIRYLETNRKK